MGSLVASFESACFGLLKVQTPLLSEALAFVLACLVSGFAGWRSEGCVCEILVTARSAFNFGCLAVLWFRSVAMDVLQHKNVKHEAWP